MFMDVLSLGRGKSLSRQMPACMLACTCVHVCVHVLSVPASVWMNRNEGRDLLYGLRDFLVKPELFYHRKHILVTGVQHLCTMRADMRARMCSVRLFVLSCVSSPGYRHMPSQPHHRTYARNGLGHEGWAHTSLTWSLFSGKNDTRPWFRCLQPDPSIPIDPSIHRSIDSSIHPNVDRLIDPLLHRFNAAQRHARTKASQLHIVATTLRHAHCIH